MVILSGGFKENLYFGCGNLRFNEFSQKLFTDNFPPEFIVYIPEFQQFAKINQQRNMTDFQPRQFSNGNTLKNFQKQKVSCFVKVQEIMDKKFKGLTTDDKSLLVFCGSTIPNREGEWVEIIGTPRGMEQFAADEVSSI